MSADAPPTFLALSAEAAREKVVELGGRPFHADVVVPNGSESLFPFHYHGQSNEASEVWLFAEAGGRTIIHSDSSSDIQRLNQEAGKALYSGRAAGVSLTEDQALQWITANPAWAMGLEKVVGTLSTGKRADVVV